MRSATTTTITTTTLIPIKKQTFKENAPAVRSGKNMKKRKPVNFIWKTQNRFQTMNLKGKKKEL